MTSARHWLQIFLAGCVWTQVSSAQTGTTGTTSGGTTTGGTSGTTGTSGNTTGSGTSGRTAPKNAPTEADPLFPSGGTTGGTGTTTGGTGATKPASGATSPAGPIQPPAQTPSDPFGFGNPLTPAGPTSPFGTTNQTGASSTFGTEPRNARPAAESAETAAPAGPKVPEAEAPSYNVPSFYGANRQVLTAGQGRLARPRFRYNVSAGIGFDDNTQQTPDNQEDIPDQVVTQVIPAEPEIAVFQTERVQVGTKRFLGGAGFVPVFKNVTKKIVLRPAIPEQTVETVIPGIDFPERNASVVSRIDGRVDAQWANARSLFVLDGRIGAEYYWNRDQDPLEFNGSLGASYVRRLGPKMQFSGNLSMSYQSQPDYSQVNLVNTAGSSGSYFAGNMKLDLSYRWAPRFSTLTSLTGNTILYEGTRTTSNYWEAGLGNEFRWIQSPKTTWIAELRYSELQYLELPTAISTAFLLLGADWTFSRKLRSTIRLGESVRTFDTGGNASTPYGEVSLAYQPNRREQFTFTGRYGFEQTSSATDENIVGRFSLGYSRTFSPRFVGSLSGNYVHTNVTSAGGLESTNEVIDGSLVFQYMFTRKFSMNARYSYTLSTTSAGFSDYDRSRFYLTGQYEF